MSNKSIDDIKNTEKDVRKAINEIPNCASTDSLSLNKKSSGKPFLLNELGHGDIGYQTDKTIIEKFPCKYCKKIIPNNDNDPSEAEWISSWTDFFEYIAERIRSASENGLYSVNIMNIPFQWVTPNPGVITMIIRHITALNYKCKLHKNIPQNYQGVIKYTLSISWSNIDDEMLDFN